MAKQTHIVYTQRRVRAIIEETRLDEVREHDLYELVQSAKAMMNNPQPESINPREIQDLERELHRYERSCLAQHYRGELLSYEAARILEGRDVFQLERVGYLMDELRKDIPHNPAVREQREELDELCYLVQTAQHTAQHNACGSGQFNESQVRWLLNDLAPYNKKCSTISGLYRKLAQDYELSRELGSIRHSS